MLTLRHRDGLRTVRTLLPDIIENGGASFDETKAAIRRSDYSMLLCYVPANPLNPEAIPQLKVVWQEINVLLRDIANTKEQAGDKHVTGKEVISTDVAAYHETFNTG